MCTSVLSHEHCQVASIEILTLHSQNEHAVSWEDTKMFVNVPWAWQLSRVIQLSYIFKISSSSCSNDFTSICFSFMTGSKWTSGLPATTSSWNRKDTRLELLALRSRRIRRGTLKNIVSDAGLGHYVRLSWTLLGLFYRLYLYWILNNTYDSKFFNNWPFRLSFSFAGSWNKLDFFG